MEINESNEPRKRKNLEKIKEHRMDTKFLVSGLLILFLLFFMSITFILKQSLKTTDAVDQSQLYRSYITQLMQTSDYLTNRVYYYVSTGDKKYCDEYRAKIAEQAASNVTVAVLLELAPNPEDKKILKDSLDLKQKVGAIEDKAFVLMEEGKQEEAQKLIFTSEYVGYKDQMQINTNKIKATIESRVHEEAERATSLSIITYFISIAVGILTSSGIVLLLLAFFRVKKESSLDQMTGLQNRNTYKDDIAKLINSDKEKYGALIYCDIDNLKFINECYGHSNGDTYIKTMANVLKIFGEYKSVIARPSGDEFIVYIHGFNSKDEVMKAITEKMSIARDSYFKTTLHIEEKLRFSTGIAMYPIDTNNVDDLIKFADYSMYKIKKNSKGEIGYYDRTATDSTLFLARNSGFLDEFLDKELVDFAMQPIVDANTFEIYGYEALMRPQSDVISTPYLVLELAKVESKLDKIERLVVKKVLEKIEANKDDLLKYKIFMNSIADQIFTEEEINYFAKEYEGVLKNVVVEVTEQEYVGNDLLKYKTDSIKRVGALVAIDDYGSGYSNDNTLLNCEYDIIKLDMNLIRNIDTDDRREHIVKSVINFSNSQGYKVVAEGVETENEVRKLRELGIHYMQGYFFGKPDIEIKGISEKAKKYLELEK